MIDDILEDARRHMETSLSVLDRDLKAMRTGRAHVSLIENLPVEAYGSTMPLIGLAGLSVPDARLLVIQPYDKNTIPRYRASDHEFRAWASLLPTTVQ